MRKNKLLLLLALLLTAATGAWAQDAKHLITATYREQTRSLEQPLPYATTIGELYEAVSGVSFNYLVSTMSGFEMPLTGISSKNTSVVSIGELNGASTPVTVIADGKATISINFGSYAHGILVSAISPLYANMKSGVKDADKWTVKVGDGQAQALPIGGLKGDGSETVTLQYNGRLKVKGVKATSDAPAAPASTTLNNTITAWTAGKYAVPAGGLTYSDAITVSGDVTLTLTDGETLTLNKGISLASGATLTVEGNGTMNVNGTNENTTSTVAGSTGTLILTSGTLTATGGNGGSVDVVESDAHGGNGGVAINGSVIVSGGSLTARGGNGGSVDYQSANCSGGNGGDAISGSVTVSGGTLTASGGNGGSVGDYGSECSGGNGGDAISGTLTKNGGSTSVNDGSNGSIGNMCDNCTAGTGGKGEAGSGGDIPNSDPYTPGGDPFSF